MRATEQYIDAWINDIQATWRNCPKFQVDQEKLKHLAVICDGNRRAARLRDLPDYFGHRVGVEVIKGLAKASRLWNIKALTFWVWSTENWQRDSEQVEFVMGLAKEFLPKQELLDEFLENQVRFTHLGRKDRLPHVLENTLKKLEEATRNLDKYYLNLALDYGGLDEVARAVKQIGEFVKVGILDKNILSKQPDSIYEFLDTRGQFLPDLVIRTGIGQGEIPRTSGFMPLQSAYAGWVFLPDLFPDLTPNRLLEPIKQFLGYQRRMGR